MQTSTREDAPSNRSIADIGLWLADQALRASEAAPLIDGLPLRLRAVGLPVLRLQVSFTVLHPLYDASVIRCDRGRRRGDRAIPPPKSASPTRFAAVHWPSRSPIASRRSAAT